MEKKLMEYLTFFDFTDLIGFAKYMNVDDELIKKVLLSSAAMSETNEEDWENLVCQTVENYSNKNRLEKRRILKMAKQIKSDNADSRRAKEQESLPTE